MAEGLANSRLLMNYSNPNPSEPLNTPKVTVYLRFTVSCFLSPKGFYSCLNARKMFLHQFRLFPDLVGPSEAGHIAVSNLTACQDVFQEAEIRGPLFLFFWFSCRGASQGRTAHPLAHRLCRRSSCVSHVWQGQGLKFRGILPREQDPACFVSVSIFQIRKLSQGQGSACFMACSISQP